MNKLHLNNEETNGFFIYLTDNDVNDVHIQKTLTQGKRKSKGIENEQKSNNKFVDKNKKKILCIRKEF